MKQPTLLQRFLSHFVEIPMGEYRSEYNPQLRVLLHRGRFKLVTLGAIYSFSDLYSNFSMSFDQLEWKKLNIQSCLVLGLGLGSIPDMLTGRFNRKIKFTAVEIDELVIQLANDYVLKPKHIDIQTFTADAASFLEWHKGKYDMICSDVFSGDRIPLSLQTEAALKSMKEMLKPGGILLYNRLSRFEPDTSANLKFRDEVFLKVFPEGGYLDVKGNWMFVNNLKAFKASGKD